MFAFLSTKNFECAALLTPLFNGQTLKPMQQSPCAALATSGNI
jgi:hypothetical protein